MYKLFAAVVFATAVGAFAGWSAKGPAFAQTIECDDSKSMCSRGLMPLPSGILLECARFIDEDEELIKFYCFPKTVELEEQKDVKRDSKPLYKTSH